MTDQDERDYDRYLETGEKPKTLEELQKLTMEDLENPKHTCINHFGKISVTFIEYEFHWKKEETAQCKVCGKVYVNEGAKIFKRVIKYGCQLHRFDWVEVK